MALFYIKLIKLSPWCLFVLCSHYSNPFNPLAYAEAKHLCVRVDMVLQPCWGVTGVSPGALFKSPSLFSEWGSQPIWGLDAVFYCELCPVLGTEEETITCHSADTVLSQPLLLTGEAGDT